MPIKFRPLAFYSIALAAVAACAPDLDALSTDFAGGAGGTGGSTGGTSATGGSDSGSGGTEMPGTGGSDPTGGDGGDSGDSGTGGSVGGSAGKGGSSGTGGSSTAASCMNESTDANESDTDCGGTSDCKRCPLTSVCSRNADCASAYCKNRRCAQATCADGSKNQDETAIDCGGTCAPELACDDGQACRIDDDCESEFCSDEVCTDHCTSDRREANETDKDCGGPDCDPCTTGKRCTQQEDCESKVCNNNQCQAATCSDEIRNQDESDQDCGGVCSQEEKACENGLRCNTGSDCETYVCNSSGRCANDIEILADAVIDYFEDGNSILPATGGRAGNWYVYGDGSGLASGGTEAIPGKRGAQSSFAFHTSGGDFTVWGSGMGVDLNNSGGGQVSKEPYDASAYSGVTFWARAATAMSITAVFPDGNTDAAGANGPDPNPTPCVVCDHHWTAGVAITPTWKRYTVLFADLALEPSGDPIPTAPDPAHLVSIQFRVPSGTTYDFWIDDVAFVE